jgi:ABC-type sugar transport system substrate-binding protein
VVLCLGGAVSLAVAQQRQAPAQSNGPRIALFSPSSENNSYWPQVFRIIAAVAEDLGFQFVPYSLGVQDRFARELAAIGALRANPAPEAVILPVVIGQGKRVLDVAETLALPIFIMGPLFPSELPELGGAPRTKYKRWTALFNWAEEQKGYALAAALITEARRARAFARDGKIHVIGLGGDPSWFGSGLRQAGLTRAIAEHADVALKQVVPTKWTAAEGRDLTAKLLRRFPEASVVWAASDQLGAGASEALLEAKRSLGKTAFTGGLDLSDLGLRLVMEGKFVATAASTMLSYAQVAVLTYDYLHAFDFAGELGTELAFPTYVATRANAREHVRLSRCLNSIDFRKFSKVYNKGLKRYDFSLEAFSAAAQNCPAEAESAHAR